MDNTELHFLTFDPEEMYRDMTEIYMANGGEALYPGDEKEILLRGVQAIMVTGFAAVDNALRMSTLRYATGQYLDLIGENRGCERLGGNKAHAKVTFTFSSSSGTVKKGTRITADGKTIYTVDMGMSIANPIGGGASVGAVITVNVTAEEAGEDGNLLTAGTEMQLLESNPKVVRIACTTSASGGTDKESDDDYRERIRNYGLTNNTTGPRLQYESRAKEASGEIIDVHAMRGTGLLDNGTVNIVLLVPAGQFSTIKPLVEAALNDERVRPLTDIVVVQEAIANDYTLRVQYKQEAGSNISADVAKAVEEYQKWQDGKIGRAFNPDRLMAAIYSLGATRVVWGQGSNFEGEPVEYTEILEDNCCKGTITVEVLT